VPCACPKFYEFLEFCVFSQDLRTASENSDCL